MPGVYPLTIGNVTLNGGPFEGPNGDKGGLGDLGSTMKAAEHEFDGGVISVQLLGSFPKIIGWEGILFGNTCQDRSAELQNLCDNQTQSTPFSWGQFNFLGYVKDYQCNVHGPNEIHYKLTYRPVQNQSTASGGNAPPSNDPNTGILSNSMNTLQGQASSPASGYTFDPGIPQAVNNITQSVNQGLQSSSGSVVNMPLSTVQGIQSGINNLQNQLQGLINGSDPIAASAAADLSGTLNAASFALAQTTVTQGAQTITLVNPDIYQVAAQYYGDVRLVEPILKASGITDTLPTGEVKLTIPPLPPSSGTAPPTVMSDA